MDSTLFLSQDIDSVALAESNRLNYACSQLLNESIGERYRNYSLNASAVIEDALDAGFSPERIGYVIAVRVYDNEHFDARISVQAEDWAKEFLKDVPDMYKNKDDNSNPLQHMLCSFLSNQNGLADLLAKAYAREYPSLTLSVKQADEKEHTSRRSKEDYER